MAIALIMPRLGETVTEGTVIKWLKNEGDLVKKDEYIVEVSTAKVETEIPSPATGVLSKILVQEDQTVPVGTELALIEEVAHELKEKPETEAKPEEEKEVAVTELKPQAPLAFVSPIVRKLAREYNIDLSTIKGTGEGGRITRKDIEDYIKAVEKVPKIKTEEIPEAPKAELPLVSPPPEYEPAYPNEKIVAMNHLRREIAAHMMRSLQTSAQVTAIVEVDITNVSTQRNKVKEAFKKREGFSLTYLPFVAKATIDALTHFPMFNARILDEHNMALHDYINLGIAVAVENGLIVPVIKNAQDLSLLGLAHKIHELAEKARNNTLSPDDVVGSTFTITNPGSFGSIIQTPIINQPNVAILSLELIQKRPVVIDNAIAIRDMVFMPLTYDHRLIDGALAAQFLSRIKNNLETWDFSPDLSNIG